MGYQPRVKSPRGAIHGHKKPFREKKKDRKRIRRGNGNSILEKSTFTEKQISELTLKRLHVLGIQKFGSFPFSLHFDRWLATLSDVLVEFETYPTMTVDKKIVTERSQVLANIKYHLEGIRRREATLDRELESLSEWRSRLKLINKEYATLTGAIKGQRNREIKSLYVTINRLKREQDEVIRMKTGFFRGISKKKRELKEMAIVKELNDKQIELELAMLDFNAKQKELRAEYDLKREPVLEEIKKFRRIIQNMETDGSLEERWFACETLIDAVNAFMQRKAFQSPSSDPGFDIR
jgi:hypothetical protein